MDVKATAGGWPLTIRYMNGRLPWIQKLLPAGSFRFLAGRVVAEGSRGWAMLNPLSAERPEDVKLKALAAD